MTTPRHPRHSMLYGAEVAASYDDAQRGVRRQLHEAVAWTTLAPLLPPAGARILDAGAGTGRYALPLLEAGFRVTLLDPAPAMLDVARRKAAERGAAERASFLVGSLDALAFPDGSFDFVLSEGDPLSYCADAGGAAREVLRVLAPGGAFYAGVDSRWLATLGFLMRGEPARAREAAERGRSVDPYGAPVRAFEPRELRALFESAGALDVRVGGNAVLHHLLSDTVLSALEKDDEALGWLVGFETRAATDPALAGLAGHLYASGRKPEGPR